MCQRSISGYCIPVCKPVMCKGLLAIIQNMEENMKEDNENQSGWREVGSLSGELTWTHSIIGCAGKTTFGGSNNPNMERNSLLELDLC